MCGFLDVYVGLWVCGCVGLWVCMWVCAYGGIGGCVGLWVSSVWSKWSGVEIMGDYNCIGCVAWAPIFSHSYSAQVGPIGPI